MGGIIREVAVTYLHRAARSRAGIADGHATDDHGRRRAIDAARQIGPRAGEAVGALHEDRHVGGGGGRRILSGQRFYLIFTELVGITNLILQCAFLFFPLTRQHAWVCPPVVLDALVYRQLAVVSHYSQLHWLVFILF